MTVNGQEPSKLNVDEWNPCEAAQTDCRWGICCARLYFPTLGEESRLWPQPRPEHKLQHVNSFKPPSNLVTQIMRCSWHCPALTVVSSALYTEAFRRLTWVVSHQSSPAPLRSRRLLVNILMWKPEQRLRTHWSLMLSRVDEAACLPSDSSAGLRWWHTERVTESDGHRVQSVI